MEDVYQPFVKVGVDSEAWGVPVTGNVGFQAVYTDQSSKAPAVAPGGSLSDEQLFSQTSGGDSYTDFLPSLNLNFQISEQQMLRLGIARTLARPRMDELRASQELTLDYGDINVAREDINDQQKFWSASGGNPELEPWRANSFDLSYELYFPQQRGYFSVATYYKDLKSWVYTADEAFDFSSLAPSVEAFIALAKANLDPDLMIPLSDGTTVRLADYPDTPATTIGTYNAPRNGEGGRISGAELSLTLNGDLLDPALQNFGIILNYSFNHSSVRTTSGSDPVELPGLSKKVANFTLFYEKGGFAARVARRYRSDFIGELQGFGAGREFKRVDDEEVIDAQVSYTFPDSSGLSGLSFFLQGTNLNNEPLITYQGNDKNQVIDYQEYGSTWLLGAGYKF